MSAQTLLLVEPDPRAVARRVVERASWTIAAAPRPGELWLYSARTAGLAMTGLELCGALDPSWRVLTIDPGGADAVSLALNDVTRRQLRELAVAVPLERTLDATAGEALGPLARHGRLLIAYEGGELLTGAARTGRFARGALAFTASDAVDGLYARLDRRRRALLEIRTISTRALLAKAAPLALDALWLNPYGPRATHAFHGDALRELVDLARTLVRR